MWFSSVVLSAPQKRQRPRHGLTAFIAAKDPPQIQKPCVGGSKTIWCLLGCHERPIKTFLNPMYIFAKDLMCKVQSNNFACTDFWNSYLVQMGAEIRVSVVDVDTDFLLSQNWPPNSLVRHGSWRSCSETDSATTDCKARKQTTKNGRNATEFLNSVDLGKVWPPLVPCGHALLTTVLCNMACNDHVVHGRPVMGGNPLLWANVFSTRWSFIPLSS